MNPEDDEVYTASGTLTVSSSDWWSDSSGSMYNETPLESEYVRIPYISDTIPMTSEGVLACTADDVCVFVPVDLFTFIAASGMPFVVVKDGLIMNEKHLAIVLLRGTHEE